MFFIKKHDVKSYVAASLSGIRNKDICGAIERAMKKAKETLRWICCYKKHSNWNNVTHSMENCDMDSNAEDDGDEKLAESAVNEDA